MPTRKPSETSDALLAYDAGERLRSIRKPTLLMAAADDLLVPWQLSELIAEEIAHARLVKLDHGGHHFIFRKRALYEQVGFDRRSASRNTPQEIGSSPLAQGNPAAAAHVPRARRPY